MPPHEAPVPGREKPGQPPAPDPIIPEIPPPHGAPAIDEPHPPRDPPKREGGPDGPYRQSLLGLVLVVAALASPAFESKAQVPQPPSDSASPSVVVANDVLIVEQVRAALGDDSVLAGSSIKVASNHGMVVLAGTVREATHIERAVDVARRVPGVRTVSASIAFIAPDVIASLS